MQKIMSASNAQKPPFMPARTVLIQLSRYYISARKCVCLILLALIAMSSACRAQSDRVAIKNGGFEEGTAGWDIPNNAAKVVDGVSHHGTRSLYYQNTDPERYLYFTQVVDAQPGQNVRYSVSVKGQNIQHKDGKSYGAGIFMESFNGSTYLGGEYPPTKIGSFDWTQLHGEYTVPLNATRTVVGLYLLRDVTGEAWFDNVEVVVEAVAPFKSSLRFPNYRGILQSGNNAPWKIGVQINKNPDWKPNPIKMTNTLIDANQKVLSEEIREIKSDQKDVTITFQPPKNLQLGQYTLRQSFVDPNGNTEGPFEHRIQVVEQMPRTYIDAQGFTVVDGKRFFPNGLFVGNFDVITGRFDESSYKRVADGGFNTILAYAYGKREDPEGYMDLAHKYNLKVLYSLWKMYPGMEKHGEEAFDVAADYIKRIQDKPSLLAWFTNDEMGTTWEPELKRMYDQIQRLDVKQHPVYGAVMIGGLVTAYRTGDVLGTDPYPVGIASSLIQTTFHTRTSVSVADGVKGVWMVPQIFDWAVYVEGKEERQPTLDEMRNQAYQAIIGGATGLIWFSDSDLFYGKAPRNWGKIEMDLFHKRWKDVSAMGREVESITPLILKDQKIPLNLPEKAEVEVGAWQDGDELMLLMANPYYEEKSITFELPKGWEINNTNQGDLRSSFANGKATFTLPSVGSGVFRLVRN